MNKPLLLENNENLIRKRANLTYVSDFIYPARKARLPDIVIR